jgi:hypothetical protein
MKEHK